MSSTRLPTIRAQPRRSPRAAPSLQASTCLARIPPKLRVLHQLGYRALLGVGIFDQERGYLVEIYFDSDHTELTTVAPHARVLAHYCVRNITAGPVSTRSQ